MLSEVFESFGGLSPKEVSSFLIDLFKIKSFIKSDNELWTKLGFAHSVGVEIDDFFSHFELSPTSINFIESLFKKGALFNVIEGSIESAIEELRFKSDLEFIVCKTAFCLEEKNKLYLRRELESIFRKQIYIEYIVDRSISGGCSIEFREYNIDVSYKNSFSNLVKEKIVREIMKGKSDDN